MNYFFTKSAIIFISVIHLSYSQIDEYRRQRNPYEFYQLGESHPNDIKQHVYIAQRLSSVPPIGTSDFVRYFSRQTSDVYLNKFRYSEENDSNNDNNIVIRRLPLIDNPSHNDLHSSHRNFVSAGVNKYYAVRTPPSHEPMAPIVGHYFSSHEDKHKGGKLYLGNRPLYF